MLYPDPISNRQRERRPGSPVGPIRYSDAKCAEYLERVAASSTRTIADLKALTFRGLPSFSTVWRRPEYRDKLEALIAARERAYPLRDTWLTTYTEEAYDRAIKLLASMNFMAYSRHRLENPGEALPTYQAVQKRAERNKAFGERVYAVRPPKPWRRRGRALLTLEEADRYVPRYLSPQDREDIKHDLVTAVLAGEITIAEVRANVDWYKNEHLRGAIDMGRFESIDAPLFEDSNTGLIDRLSTDATSYY